VRSRPGALHAAFSLVAVVAVVLTACSSNHAHTSDSKVAAASSDPSTPNASSLAAGPSPSAATSTQTAPKNAPKNAPTSAATSTLPPIDQLAPTGISTTQPPRPISSAADFGGGVAARVTKFTHGKEIDTGKGIIAGVPVVTFTIAFSNGTAKAISVNNVQVDVTYGSAQTPAPQSNFAETTALTGSLGAGMTRSGTYAFSIPTTAQQDVEVTVWYATDQPTIALVGSVAG
jgi:hypothetical protein